MSAERLMKEYGVSFEIAKSAWNACCDGNYLANVLSEVPDDVDPWDGKHEELRKEVESDAIREALSDAIKEAENNESAGGFMRDVRVTRAGFLYVDGKKASPKRITPLYVGQDVLTQSEQKIARKWAYDHYKMVNN